jgi:hypothetical protein
VEAVRNGSVDVANVRREPAESNRFVQVREEAVPADQRTSYDITGSSIKSTVAA